MLMMIVAMAAVAAPPFGPPPPLEQALEMPPAITNPDWDVKPSGEAVARYYPDRAQRLELEGRAVVVCKVDVEGRLHDCLVDEEIPKGVGFGEATKLLAQNEFRMRPRLERGIPVESAVRIPLAFKLPETSDTEWAKVAAETAADQDAQAFAKLIAGNRTAITVFGWLSLVIPLGLLVLLALGSRRRPPDI